MRARFQRLAIATLFAVAFAGTARAQVQERLVANAYNSTGQALLRHLSAQSGNIVFSPYSIGTAMAMALTGARTTTEEEMLSVFKLKMTRPEVEDANSKLMAALNGYDKSAAPPSCPQGMELDGQRCFSKPVKDKCPLVAKRDELKNCIATPTVLPWIKLLTANALMMPRPTDEISLVYVDALKKNFQAEVFRGAGLDQINNWVKQRTEGKIDKLLEKLDPSSPAVLLNAIYFKASWANGFSKSATTEANFNLTRSQQTRVPTMHRSAPYQVIQRAGYRALRIPYQIQTLGMVVVLPNDIEGLDFISKRLDDREMSDMLTTLRKTPAKFMALALPRFKTAFKADLKPAFQQIGLSLPFSDIYADFSGMTGKPLGRNRLIINQIMHAAVIEVQEEGTEAAAATAIEMMPTSARRVDEFIVDRPFLFYITDDLTGAVLFQGRINNPR
jgi:serpin B